MEENKVVEEVRARKFLTIEYLLFGLLIVFGILTVLFTYNARPDLFLELRRASAQQNSYILPASYLENLEIGFLSGENSEEENTTIGGNEMAENSGEQNGNNPVQYSPARNNNFNIATSSYQAKNVSNCTDCLLYPVDKNNALSASYTPKNLVQLNVRGGGRMVDVAAVALTELFTDAESKGLFPRVNSSYRSYTDQLSTFNYWVNLELGRGATRAEAEVRANRYSARPGHSEHQLGTTADIGCEGCSGFDRTNAKNNAIWNYIEENAHKFGFVISYPKNSETLTGYVYEPWHIRYVGKEIAEDLYSKGYVAGNGWYIARLLATLN